MGSKVKNYLSFDVESWFDSEFVIDKNLKKDFIKESLDIVLPFLDKHNIKATFFVTGDVLEKYPEEINKVFKKGHEISSHGYTHKMLKNQEKKEVILGLIKSKKMIKRITGKNPLGFRAPSWSISKKEFWIYEELDKLGFKYSSSLFPVNMGLYGSADFPIKNFNPLKNSRFLEIPVRPFLVSKIRIPFSGGVYFRMMPFFMIKYFINKINKKGYPVMVYLHPWEFYGDIPKVKTTLIGKVTTYYGIKKNLKKFDKLLSEFNFVPLREAV
jgi:polysaccharide deacetylase family protein (PEP-CTERM system associated)